jgi:hypothetical protein
MLLSILRMATELLMALGLSMKNAQVGMRGKRMGKGITVVRAATLIASGVAFLAGCAGDPKAASTENFARVIAARYAKGTGTGSAFLDQMFGDTQPCLQQIEANAVALPTEKDPVVVLENPKDADANPGVFSWDSGIKPPLVNAAPESITKLQVLVSAGLLKKMPGTVPWTRVLWNGKPPVKIRLPIFRYAPVQDNAATYCYAVLGLDHVENFSAPVDANGFHVTQVTYFRKVESVKDWAENAQVRAAFPEIDTTLTQIKTQPTNMALKLTNAGWEPML